MTASCQPGLRLALPSVRQLAPRCATMDTRSCSRTATASASACSPTALHVELRLGAGSNPTPEASGDDPGLDQSLAATREGMVSTLELQARRRLHDLLWEPQRVTARLAEIVDDLRPAIVLSDQLAFGAALAFRALDIPFSSFLPGHPCQLPPPGVPFGYPAHRPAGFAEGKELTTLNALCRRAAAAFTRQFNDTLFGLAPHARPVDDALAEPAPLGTLVNYPARLAARRIAPGATLVGPCVRDEPGDPELTASTAGASRRERTLRLEASCPLDPMSSARSPAGSGERASEP